MDDLRRINKGRKYPISAELWDALIEKGRSPESIDRVPDIGYAHVRQAFILSLNESKDTNTPDK